MKRVELIRHLKKQNCTLLRRGGRHDVYVNTNNGRRQPIPRHREIDESLARHIIKELLGG
jgi:mRNA interferase HicA